MSSDLSNNNLPSDYMLAFREKAKELVTQMTLEEKAGLCSGKDYWKLKTVERLGLETIMVSDGPHGLRKQQGDQNNFGVGDSVPSVCFPTASALACSFDRELAHEVGKALAQECLQEGVSVILGPGANQKRSPLCGRNFEYFSEDPVLSGEMAAAMIEGIQSLGVGASLKHFAVNNQEKRRMTVNAVVDERTLRETYLKAYEIAVKKSKPWTVMCAYNRLNGVYCSENDELLNQILRKEWGFDGLVMSDWGAVNDRALGVAHGLDLEMPGNLGLNDTKIITAVSKGNLSEEALDLAACRVTELILAGMANKKKDYYYDVETHHRLAVYAAEQSAVLLKNDDHILPGNRTAKAAVIGAFAKNPRYQGAGSSKNHPIRIDNAYDVFKEYGIDFTYAEGYELSLGRIEKEKLGNKEMLLIKEACEAARDKDIIYLFVGLPEGYESEGFDRRDLSLPPEQNRLIEEVAACNQNVVVILIGGAPMELPWRDKVKAILLTYLGGEGCGTAAVKLLLGEAVPSGKLAETWPLKLSDSPAYHYFPGGRNTVEYREGIYVGYRYYETIGKKVQFSFGHGLSYTEFAYLELSLDREECKYGEKFSISFGITNTGSFAAKETALIFVSHKNEKVFLPKKELCEFVKVELLPGETKQVTVTLDTKTFGYYNTLIHDWYAENGDYLIQVGASLDTCDLKAVLRLTSCEQAQPDYRLIAPTYFNLSGQELLIPDQEFASLYGKELPISDHRAVRPYDHCNTLEDVSHTLIGKLLMVITNKLAKNATKASKEEEGMITTSMNEMPFHSILTSSEGMITDKMMEGIIDLLNGHYLKGMIKIIKRK